MLNVPDGQVTTSADTGQLRLSAPGLAALLSALTLIAVAALIAWAWQGLPLSLALSAFLMVVAAGFVSWAGAVLAGNDHRAQGQEHRCVRVFRLLGIAMVTAGLGVSFIGMLQVFAPQLAHGIGVYHS